MTDEFTGTLTNTATIASDSDETNPNDNTSTLTTPVKAMVNLFLTKTASASLVGAGDTFSYTITLDNFGPSDAVDVNVKDLLPEHITTVEALVV